MLTLDIHADLSADGHLSETARTQIARHLRSGARGLDSGETRTVRVRIGPKLRTGAQNRLYWPLLDRVSLAFVEATGRAYPTDSLHLYAKQTILPAVAALLERETGELVEYRRTHALPDGSERVTYTTTTLSVEAFTAYLEAVVEHFQEECGLPLDVSDLMEGTAKIRSGKLAEPSDLALVPMGEMEPAEDRAPSPTPSAAQQQRTMVDLFEMSRYLFPVPAKPLRSLLDAKAQGGAEFTDDEAALDVMLALDRDDLKPIRYYVKRWAWTRYRVHSALPALQETAAGWRSFHRTTAGQDQTDSGQDQTGTGPDGTKNADSQTGSGQDQTDSGQYRPDSDTRPREDDGVGPARAHEGPGPEGADLSPADLAAFGGSYVEHRAEIEDTLATVGPAPDWQTGAAGALVARSLRSGAAPPGPVVAALSGVASRLGVAAAVAALVVTRRGADPRSRFQSRLRYLTSVVESLEDHVTAARYAADPRNAPAHAGDGCGAVGSPGVPVPSAPGAPLHGAGRARGVRGAPGPAGGPRLSAAERRGQFGPDRAAELVAAARALREGRGGDGDAGHG